MRVSKFVDKCAGWAWDRLREARQVRCKLGEESLTDLLLLACCKLEDPRIRVRTFTRIEEYETGADWEWWLTGRTGKWLGIRLQAKVISFPKLEYTHLHYRRSDGRYQADQLILDSQRTGTIPAFCLYSNWQVGKIKPTWRCVKHRHSARHFGISLVSLHDVISLRPYRRDVVSLLPALRPLRCVLCCAGDGGEDLPARAYRFLSNEGFVDSKRLPSWQTPEGRLLRGEPPIYVSRLLDKLADHPPFELPDESLRRVTIFVEQGGD